MKTSYTTKQRVAAVLAALVVLLALASIDYRPARPAGAPEVVQVLAPSPITRAGAARGELEPPFPVPLGGFHTRGDAPHAGVLDAPGVRALVLEAGDRRVALVSAELVVIPAALRARVLERVATSGITELVLSATHTHSGPGGYWDRWIAEWIGLATYDPKIEAFLVERIASAIGGAVEGLRPARLAAAGLDASNFSFNRAQERGPVDTRLTALRVDAEDGTAIARLVVFAVHPTMLGAASMWMSGDWPGSMLRSLEESSGCPVLFWQGAVGDQTWGKRAGNMKHEERMVRFGQAVATDARGAIAAAQPGEGAPALAFARVRVQLPPSEVGGAVWGPFEPLAANVMQLVAHPGSTTVSVLRAGPFEAALLPGELVADLGRSWRAQLGGATIVSLADDYVGYVESPELVAAELGEAQRQYFAADLAPVLLEGLVTARAALAPASGNR